MSRLFQFTTDDLPRITKREEYYKIRHDLRVLRRKVEAKISLDDINKFL